MPPYQPYLPPTAYKPKKRLGLWVAFILTFLMLLGAAYGALVFYQNWQDYKNNADLKINQAVKIAVQQESTKKDTEFTEKEKSPYKVYNGSPNYGSIQFNYPKNWSVYLVQKDQSRNQVDGYFEPQIVPDVTGGTPYALRLQLIDTPFDQVAKDYDSRVKNGKLKWSSYSLPQLTNIVGAYATGEIATNKNGAVVIVPIRDKTIVVWTESPEHVNDLNDVVLKSFKFSP